MRVLHVALTLPRAPSTPRMGGQLSRRYCVPTLQTVGAQMAQRRAGRAALVEKAHFLLSGRNDNVGYAAR